MGNPRKIGRCRQKANLPDLGNDFRVKNGKKALKPIGKMYSAS
jgi:hypothetical protein